MAEAVVFGGVVLSGLVALLCRAADWRPFRAARRPALSPVGRQHLDLLHGGRLSPAAVESAKCSLRPLAEGADPSPVEGELRPGTDFAVRVQALAELGTETARVTLERQLQRRLSDDPLEQSWYLIDVARGLRTLNRVESLPALLRCAAASAELPLAHVLAAEAARFNGFADFLRVPHSPLGQAAIRALHSTLEGLRAGLPPQLVADAKLGEAVVILWEALGGEPDPVAVRVWVEAVRLAQRAGHAELFLGDDVSRSALRWQVACLNSVEPKLAEHLAEAAPAVASGLPRDTPAGQRDRLLALIDLKADTSAAVLPLLAKPDFPHVGLAAEALARAKDQKVCGRLCALAYPAFAGTGFRRRSPADRVWATLPAVLRALRGHPSYQSEALLLRAAREREPAVKAAALSALGWWEPLHRDEVRACLQAARRDRDADARAAARAALARLGERAALREYRAMLSGGPSPALLAAVKEVAREGLTWLWPDLDRLADAEDAEVAVAAREALEQLREELVVAAR